MQSLREAGGEELNKLFLLLPAAIAIVLYLHKADQEDIRTLRQQLAAQTERVAALETLVLAIDDITRANARGIQDTQGKTQKLKAETYRIRSMAEETRVQVEETNARVDDARSDIQRARDQIDAVQKRTRDLETAFGLPYEDHLTP
jgi:chromosome segregation ATPase